jgi:acyl-CoA thioesterase
MGPNGGYLATIVLRAMAAAVADPLRAPRSLTLHYLRPPAAGAVELEVAVERAGGSVTSLSARMTQDGRLCVLALGAFAVELPSAAEYAAAPPAVAPYADVEAAPGGEGIPPIFERLETRPALGGAMFAGGDEARTGGWMAFRAPRVVDAPALATFVDAWWPAPFTRLTVPIAAPTVELTVHFRAQRPVDGPVLGVFASRTSAEGFFEEDGELYGQDGVLLAQSRQLALMRPLR